MVGSNGFNRRRYRTNNLRDSPDEDTGLELHETVRLRDRVKKDRDRDRNLRGRDLRERPNRIINSIRRRRNERLMNRRGETGHDETSQESVTDDEDDEVEDSKPTTTNRHHHQNNSSIISQAHHSNNINNSSFNNLVTISSSSSPHLEHRKSFPLPNNISATSSKAFRVPPVWRSGDEVISVSVPRKARSSSTKRTHELISSSSGGDQILRQTSDSPAIHGYVSASNQPPMIRKKLKPGVNDNGPKSKPPKVASQPSSSNPEELEIEIAEVLYGLRTQSQGPSPSSKHEEVVNRSSSDAKSRNSSPVSNSTSNNNLGSWPNSCPLTAVACKRTRPRQVQENMRYDVRSSTTTVKDVEQTPKSEILSPLNSDKASPSTGENCSEVVGSYVISQVEAAQPPETTAEVRDNSNLLIAKEEILSSKENECSVVRTEGFNTEVSTSLPTSKLKMYQEENDKEEKFEIDLMAPPPQVRSSPGRETGLDLKPVLSAANADLKPVILKDKKEDDKVQQNQEKKRKWTKEAAESLKGSCNSGLKIDLQFDLEKPERDGSDGAVINKLAKIPAKDNREDPVPENHGQSTSSLPLPLSLASWPTPMGYMAPLQGVVVSMDGTAVTQAPPVQTQFSRPCSKRCVTHCHIASNIYYQQQFMKMNPFWPGANPSPLLGPKPCNLNVMPGSDNNAQDKSQNPKGGSKVSSRPTDTSDSSQRKQFLIQQALPPVAPNNLMGPAFIFPLNQQQAALSARSSNGKSPNTGSSSLSMTPGSSAHSTTMSFNYANMGPSDAQYLAFLRNNGYAFPVPTGPSGFRGPPAQAIPMFNGSFYPQQLQQPPPVSQPQQNSKPSNGSSSSQKHLQQRPQSAGNAKTQNVASQKSQNNQQKMNSEEDSLGSRVPAVNIYGQNFAIPIHPQNFALLTPSAAFSGNSQSEKKANQATQQQGVKIGVESSVPHGFAVSFGPSMDMSSMVHHHHHTIFQNSPHATQPKKNARVSIDGKSSGGDSSNANDEERKGMAGKSQSSVGQSIAFGRSDLPDHAKMNVQNAYIQSQIQHQQILSLKLQQQQQFAANRSKAPTTSNGSVISEHLNASSPNAASKFPIVQMSSSGSPTQSLHWKGSTSARTSTSQAAVQSPLVSSSSSNLKGAPQQISQSQTPMHAQISFGGNHKPNAASSGQVPSSPMMVGSPTTSSVSKGVSGSPRTSVSTSTNSKISHGSSKILTQQPKNSPSVSSHKSPSLLGNPYVNSSSNNKPQNPQHPLMAKNVHQAQQLFFSSPFAQVQSPSNSSAPSAYYMNQQKRPDKNQQLMQATTTASGMLSLANNASTTDPAKAIAAANGNGKSGSLPSQGVFNAIQFGAQPSGTTLLPGFPYAQPVLACVQSKPAEQKQPADNGNLHTWQPEKK